MPEPVVFGAKPACPEGTHVFDFCDSTFLPCVGDCTSVTVRCRVCRWFVTMCTCGARNGVSKQSAHQQLAGKWRT